MKLLVLAALLITFSTSLLAQGELRVPALSPQTEMTQELGLAQIKLSYARPSAKGRKVFGDLVPFGEVWRTGANASTKLTFTDDVKIAGNALKAGTYALYSIPGPEEWTIIIHTNTKHRSLAGDVYKPAEDAFRFKVKPSSMLNHVETFTIDFGEFTTSSCNLILSWEKTKIRFPIVFDVDARVNEQIAASMKAPGGMPHMSYFLAAEYNLHNGKDLSKADEWIITALEKSPKNPRYGLLRAKILDKAGKRADALKVVAEANGWAKESKNANYTEQTQLFWDSIKK
jgi:hypothetical protein